MRERDEESMRESDRWGSERERKRETLKREKEKKKQMCQNCMSTMKVNTLCLFEL